MTLTRPYLMAMGDQAVLAYLIDEQAALSFAAGVREQDFAWVVDVVQAYTSVAVFYDLDRIGPVAAEEALRPLLLAERRVVAAGREHVIPCCYERQLDLDRVAAVKGVSPEEVVRLHSASVYTVYAIGFCPGFPYLGYLPSELTGVPRLDSPRLRVEAGSVGMTGRQTGIYTEVRPGGWNIIGQTPWELVNVADGYFPLRTGDRVRFTPINRAEYDQQLGKRLEV